MAHVPIDADSSTDGKTPTPRGRTVWGALLIAVAGAAVATGATIVVLRNEHDIGVEAMLAALALAAFGVTAYGLLQAVLAVVDSAGERRRHDREVTERRRGDRAREPRR